MEAFNGDETRGIQLYNGAQGGRTAGDFATNSGEWTPGLAVIQPHLVFIDLGHNDYNFGVTPAAMVTNLRAVIAAARGAVATNPTIVMPLYPETGVPPGGAPVATYADFLTAWRSVPATDPGVVLLDMTGRMPPAATNNAPGLFAGDLQHPTDRGHAYFADLLTPAIAGVGV
jgi:lysophospholipase L1-like esterase